jgi:hypothetical protein
MLILGTCLPRLPHIPPRLHHKNTTATAHFPQKTKQKGPSTILQKNLLKTKNRDQEIPVADLLFGPTREAQER